MTATPVAARREWAGWTTRSTSPNSRPCGFDGAIVLHQLKELAPDRLDTAFDYVREHAPAGYLS